MPHRFVVYSASGPHGCCVACIFGHPGETRHSHCHNRDKGSARDKPSRGSITLHMARLSEFPSARNAEAVRRLHPSWLLPMSILDRHTISVHGVHSCSLNHI